MDQQTGPGTEQPGRTRSLYRKYRPMTFDQDEFVGQEHISRTLRNAITQGRIAHAYLFCGPRGTGKTTTARLLAKAVNCLDPDPNNRPCNQCQACDAINQGRATDIIEIDAASNRGIEDIRDLREQVKYAPTQLQHKFYIIDEAHRLTRDAFNAFLKTLEEPPPKTTFVLATTDPDELLETVASRCQRFDFRRIPAEQMARHVQKVCRLEGISIEDEAVTIIVRHATGSMRDALSLVDMLSTAVGERGAVIDAGLTRRMLGLSQDERTLNLIEAIADRDMAAGLTTIAEVVDGGQDMRPFGRQIIAALRLMMLVRGGANPAEAGDEIKRLANRFEIEDLLRINRQFAEVDFAIRNGGFPQLPIELAFIGSLVETPAAAPQAAPQPTRTTPPPREAMTAPAAEHRPRPQMPIDEPAPVESPTSEDGSLDYFTENWLAVRTEIKARDRKIEALLASTDPVHFSENRLTLVATYPFHAGKLNEQKVRATIEEAIAAVLSVQVAVETVLKDEFDAAAPPPPVRQSPSPTTTANGKAARSSESHDAIQGAEASPPPGEPRGNDEDDEEFDQQVERIKAIFDAEEIDPEEAAEPAEQG